MKRPLALTLAALSVLTATPFIAAAPAAAAFPGRNGRIVFQRFDAGLPDLHTIKPDGTGDFNLTATPAIEEQHPAWSADGTRIALRRWGAGPDQLWVMDGNGGGLVVVPGSGTASEPAWSPDGKKLVYMCWGVLPMQSDICIRNVDGSGFTLLTATAAQDEQNPVWSPDGTRIVYSRELPAGGRFLVSLELKNLSLTPLTAQVAGTYDARPDWSPDGSELVFTRYISGTGIGESVYRMKASGGAPALVTAPGPGTDTHHAMPVWSPDGKKIAYCRLDDDGAWGNIYTIKPDGTGDTQITFGGATDEFPDWRPA